MNKVKLVPLFIIFLLSFVFFNQFIIKGKLPIPSDTIVGLYYPFREIYFKTNPNGLPYKNFLITDPVRQTYPWRNLSINSIMGGNIPLWNPYNFAGTPLLANFQSAVFYPFNILFFVFPFAFSWSILILLSPFLAGIFTYSYLNNLKLRNEASLLGAISFSFSGFFIAWMQWGTVLNTALWLPLILLSIDKIFINSKFKISSYPEFRTEGQNSKLIIWAGIFLFSFISSFFGGHLQTFFYISLFAFFYFISRWFYNGKNFRVLGLFLILNSLFLILTFVQWYPAFNFITQSARNADIIGYTNPGWFIPWQNIIQFVAPDFFGNPATLNYFGVWNYAEFVGYVGIAPLILAFFAMFFRKDKKVLFFGSAFFLSLLFAFPTIFAKIPFKLSLPFIDTAQPTRLLFITDFSLSVLAALGIDYFISLKKKRPIFYILTGFIIMFSLLWAFILFFHGNLISSDNLIVAKQNLILPTILFLISLIIFFFTVLFKEKNKLGERIIIFSIYTLILLTIVDLFRFGWKFEPFTNKEYLYPTTSVTSFLQKQHGIFRVMSDDSRIFPPNFSIMYKLQSLDGYDPLYLQRYGELMAAMGRRKPDISSPFGFNRIITPQDSLSRISDLLGVKYVLSLKKIENNKFKEVFTDGIIRVYENKSAFPRIFFVNNTLSVSSKQEAINAMFEVNYQLNSRAVVEGTENKNQFQKTWSIGQIENVDYHEDNILIKTDNLGDGFLVLTDNYYPSWHAAIDGKETKIYITDFSLRGIIVPKGKHEVKFYVSLF